ncbi:uncharacterized protein PAC_16982 [Phialocephala subalpina]|uniref:Probable beta-glucosidase I n=1 Tax=Phialocephala subalpina TaxID=576137 RepID=A0A1L7XPY7_9HELO|nr:uncharacterized protein PAC_16982 [Phialocephala subalpina]
MPGPTQWRNITVMNSFTANKLSEETINDRARNVLNLIKLTQKSGIPENAEEGSRDVEEDKVLLRKLAAESIVLMKNESSILSLKKDRTTAVIGPNARTATFCGGGSAALAPSYVISPLDGCLYNTVGKRGLTFRAYNDPQEVTSRECIEEIHVMSSNFFLTDFENPQLNSTLFYTEIEAYLTPEESGVWDFGLSASDTAILFVDGKEVIDNETKQVQEHAFFGSGTREEVGKVMLSTGTKHKILVTFGSGATSKLLAKGVVSLKAVFGWVVVLEYRLRKLQKWL